MTSRNLYAMKWLSIGNFLGNFSQHGTDKWHCTGTRTLHQEEEHADKPRFFSSDLRILCKND